MPCGSQRPRSLTPMRTDIYPQGLLRSYIHFTYPESGICVILKAICLHGQYDDGCSTTDCMASVAAASFDTPAEAPTSMDEGVTSRRCF